MSRTKMTILIFIFSELSSLDCESYNATVRNIFVRLYSSVEEVVPMCLVYKIWRLLCTYSPPPPPPPQPKNKTINFFLDLNSLSQFTY